jgi:hypothetical protein
MAVPTATAGPPVPLLHNPGIPGKPTGASAAGQGTRPTIEATRQD